jgi:hypothetical protein
VSTVAGCCPPTRFQPLFGASAEAGNDIPGFATLHPVHQAEINGLLSYLGSCPPAVVGGKRRAPPGDTSTGAMEAPQVKRPRTHGGTSAEAWSVVGQVVHFVAFRDAALSDAVISLGGQVASIFTPEVTCIVTADTCTNSVLPKDSSLIRDIVYMNVGEFTAALTRATSSAELPRKPVDHDGSAIHTSTACRDGEAMQSSPTTVPDSSSAKYTVMDEVRMTRICSSISACDNHH